MDGDRRIKLVSLSEVQAAVDRAWEVMVSTRNNQVATQPRDANNQNFIRAPRLAEPKKKTTR
jgi:hypothetical protein